MAIANIFGVFILATMSGVYGIDVDNALKNENIPCFSPPTVPVNETWMTSISTYYFPLMSVLDLYWEGVEISGKSAKDLPENEVYYDACIIYDIGPDAAAAGGAIARGFGGQSRVYAFELIGKGLQEFNWMVTRPGSTHRGTTFTTLTDNSTFHFSTKCQEGVMTWAVISTVPTLAPEKVRMIHEHAESIGFKREYFTALRYDSCPPVPSTAPAPATTSTPSVPSGGYGSGPASGGYGQSSYQPLHYQQLPQRGRSQWGRGQGWTTRYF